MANILFSDGPINIHIADDGSPDDYRERLVELAQSLTTGQVTCTNSERGGYGKNYNLAAQVTHISSDYILVIEDDWRLLKILDIDYLINVMEQEKRFGCIRLGYLGHTQPLLGEVIPVLDNQWLLLSSDSPEPHVFAGHPRLETRDFQRSVGEWPEGLLPGQTEFAVCHIPNARKGVVWPMDLIHTHGDMYAHIGTVRSY